jgi:HK97 family phage major capsid protein
MSTTTGSEGGYTVQPIVAGTLIETLKDYGAMRRVAQREVTATGVDMSWPTTDGTSETGEIVAQNASASNSDPSFGTVPLNVQKFGSKVIAIPIELLQDSSIDIVAMVMRRMRDRIGRAQNGFYTTGTGTNQPKGLVTAAGIGKTGTTGQTLTVIYDDLVDMTDSIDPAYQEGTLKWMFGQTMRRTVRKIKDTAGRPIWTPSYDAGITQKTPDMLMGYPLEVNNDMPVPAANALSMAFGNLNEYIVRDSMEVTIFRFDDSVYAVKGQVGFLAWARSGGNLLDINGVKTYKHSAT